MAEKKTGGKKAVEKMTFEEAQARMTEIVEILEEGSSPLDEMLALYEEGTALMRRANALLEEAETRVKVVENGEIKKLDL